MCLDTDDRRKKRTSMGAGDEILFVTVWIAGQDLYQTERRQKNFISIIWAQAGKWFSFFLLLLFFSLDFVGAVHLVVRLRIHEGLDWSGYKMAWEQLDHDLTSFRYCRAGNH